MSSFYIFLGLIIFVCILLMLVIMVQNPKGGGLSSSFGGSGSQVVGGVKQTGDFLDKSTWILASFLIILILVSNVSLKGSFGTTDSRVLQGGDNGGIENTTTQEALPDDVAPIPTSPIDSIQ